MTREASRGIICRASTSPSTRKQGTLQYQLKVPLARNGDHPYAIETAPGKTIGVGLETGKLQQRSFGAGRGGGFGAAVAVWAEWAAAAAGRGGGGSGGGGQRAGRPQPAEASEVVGDRGYWAGSIARTVGSAASRSSVSSGIQPTIES